MNEITKNIFYMPLLFVVCIVLWQVLSFLFKRYLNKHDNRQNEIVEQQQKTNDILAGIRCDLRVSNEKISKHDDDIDELKLADKAILTTVNKHETRITLLEEKKK